MVKVGKGHPHGGSGYHRIGELGLKPQVLSGTLR